MMLRIIVLLLANDISFLIATENPSKWNKECPPECQCPFASFSQTTMSQWLPDQDEVKLALCTMQKETETIQMFQKIPAGTEILTVLQTIDAPYASLDNSMFNHTEYLRGIDIQGAGTKSKLKLMPYVFHELSKLQYLSLKHINLARAEKIFAKLSSLEVLQVMNCNIGAIKWKILEGLDSLRELYFVHSGIKYLGEFAFYGAPELRRLFLSHNDLFSIESDSLIGLLKLEMLDLSNNQLDHLSSITFPPLPRLHWLELKHNPIKVIFPHCFQTLNNTQRLTLGHSHETIHLMKFSFRGLESLMVLHIPNIDNDILVEHMFYGLFSLLHLNINGRVMVLGSRAFIGAHKILKKLVLHNCKLKKINDDSFEGLQYLSALDLSNNQLRYLSDKMVEPLVSLNELILSQNKFTTLSEDIFHRMVLLKALRLDANPWNCTCSMMTWKESIVIKIPYTIPTACNPSKNSTCNKFETTYKDDKRIMPRCEYPHKFQGRSIFEALKYLKCNETYRPS